MIKKVKMLSKQFHGTRTMYSANSFFVAILTNKEDACDHEVIGKKILPQGFGCITPPGPSSGFGSIVLKDAEQSGKVKLASLKRRVKEDELRTSLKEYFDGFFFVNNESRVIEQIAFDKFIEMMTDSRFDHIHFVEFESD